MCGAGAAPAAAAEPADVPRVTTPAELETVAPLDAGDGWSVRLGYGEPGAEAGVAWRVLYCLAEFTGGAGAEGGDVPAIRHASIGGEPLGPVSYTWEGAAGGRGGLRNLMKMKMPGHRVALYCATLPADGPAAMRLVVFGGGERELAADTFEPPEAPPTQYWHTFAAMRRGGRIGRGVVAADEAPAAYPLFGAAPPAAPELRAPDDAGRAADGQPPAGLPGLDGAGDADRLRLALKDGAFVAAADRFMADWPDEHLLARWWVNGEPVVARVAQRMAVQQAARKWSRAKELRVAFALPHSLPPLKAGDTLALQVLYAPGGIERFQPDGGRMRRARQEVFNVGREDAARPLLSNRLEIDVTDELLGEADLPERRDDAE